MIYLVLILVLAVIIMGIVLMAKAAKKDDILGGAPSNTATVVKPLAQPENQGQKVIEAILLAGLMKTGVTFEVVTKPEPKKKKGPKVP